MIAGETVLVYLASVTGHDDFGNEVIGYGSPSGPLGWSEVLARTWGGMRWGAWPKAAAPATWQQLACRPWRETLGQHWAGARADWRSVLESKRSETWGRASRLTWRLLMAHDGERVPLTVDNVLVNPSTTTYDRIEAGRPHGFECDLTLYFPREFELDVRGALVGVRGDTYRVVGDPERYTDAALPLGCLWNLVAKVARYDV